MQISKSIFSLALVWTVQVCLPPWAESETAKITAAKATAVNTDTDARIVHMLNRLSYGARPGDIALVKQVGIQRYIDGQLNPQNSPESATVAKWFRQCETLSMTPAQLNATYGRPAMQELFGKEQKDPDSRKQARKMLHDNFAKVSGEYSGDHLVRALYSPHQLQEVMTDFWFNHFNISKDKGLDHLWVGNFEAQAIRPNALGSFRNLLGATCHHPAMLFYLDNWQNSSPGSFVSGSGRRILSQGNGKRSKSGINENYARELLELHTLGVDAGYTQADVVALAHILTGLGLPRGKAEQQSVSENGYRFYAQRHDYGTKTFLGQQVPGSGEAEIEQALDTLAKAPATAHHISYKLVQYFVADNPPPAAVDACAKAFLSSEGNIKEVLRTLFSRPEFWDPANAQAKFKSPQRYVISALRAGQIYPTSFFPILAFLKQTGQPLYGCLTPDGYKNTKEAWLNPDGLLRRVSLATALGSGRMPGTQGRSVNPTLLLSAVGPQLRPATRAQLGKTASDLQSAVILGSPEFMKY